MGNSFGSVGENIGFPIYKSEDLETASWRIELRAWLEQATKCQLDYILHHMSRNKNKHGFACIHMTIVLM